MCSKIRDWRHNASWRWRHAASALLIVGASVPALSVVAVAADQVINTDQATSAKDEEAGRRVFSKDKPLFENRIPKVTPGPDGATKAKVITGQEPAKPEEPRASKVEPASKPPAKGGGQAKPVVTEAAPKVNSEPADKKTAPPVEIINRASADKRGEPKPKAPPTAKAPEAVTGPELSVGSAVNKTDEDAQRIALPVRKPAVPVAQRITSALAAANAKERDKDQAKATESQPKRAQRRSPPSAYSPGAPRPLPRTARNRHRYDEPPVYDDRRQRGRHLDWRRGAPPGAIDSFVRCRPGGGCVRYYRVRRPRNFREFRRLRRWERWRQRWRRAERHRAWRRSYPDHYYD